MGHTASGGHRTPHCRIRGTGAVRSVCTDRPVSSARAGLCWTHCSLVPLSHSTASLMCGGPPGLLRCRALMREQGAHQRHAAGFPLSPPPPGLMFPTEMSKAAWKPRSGSGEVLSAEDLGPQSTPEASVLAPLGAGELRGFGGCKATTQPSHCSPSHLLSVEGAVLFERPQQIPSSDGASKELLGFPPLHSEKEHLPDRLHNLKGLPLPDPPMPRKSQRESAHRSFQLLGLSPFQKRLSGLNAEETGQGGSGRCEINKTRMGTSLAAQWLGLHASTAWGMGPIPGQGTKILQATRRGQKQKTKNNQDAYIQVTDRRVCT